MKNQKGATLVVALSLLTIITLVAVYTIESSTIQGRMISNSALTYSVFQDAHNELLAVVRYYDNSNNLSELLEFDEESNPHTLEENRSTPNNTAINSTLINTGRNSPCFEDEVGVDSPTECPIFEVTSVGTRRSSVSNQSMGVYAKKLAIDGTISVTE